MWVQPSAASHSDNASSSLVVVLKVRTSRLIVPSTVCRTQATTVFLWTSRPAQCGYRTSISPPAALHHPAWNAVTRTLRVALRAVPALGALRGALAFRVRLENGLSHTIVQPTSVPVAPSHGTINRAPVSSLAGRHRRWGARKKLPRQRLSLRGAAGDEAISSGVGTVAPRLLRFARNDRFRFVPCGWATPVTN